MGWKEKVSESVWGAIKGSKKKLKSSGTEAIKSVPPGVGGLKKSREAFEGMQESSAEGAKKFGRHHITKITSEQKVEKGFPGLTRQSGELERKRKKLIKENPELKNKLKR
jgi:hypothetical protein